MYVYILPTRTATLFLLGELLTILLECLREQHHVSNDFPFVELLTRDYPTSVAPFSLTHWLYGGSTLRRIHLKSGVGVYVPL